MNKGLQLAGSAVGGEHTSAGGRLVSVDGRLLPLRGIALRGEASDGLAARTALSPADLQKRGAQPRTALTQPPFSWIDHLIRPLEQRRRESGRALSGTARC